MAPSGRAVSVEQMTRRVSALLVHEASIISVVTEASRLTAHSSPASAAEQRCAKSISLLATAKLRRDSMAVSFMSSPCLVSSHLSTTDRMKLASRSAVAISELGLLGCHMVTLSLESDELGALKLCVQQGNMNIPGTRGLSGLTAKCADAIDVPDQMPATDRVSAPAK